MHGLGKFTWTDGLHYEVRKSLHYLEQSNVYSLCIIHFLNFSFEHIILSVCRERWIEVN